MQPHEIARRFLESEPTVARCDACLAFACDTSLTAMRQITARLVAADDSVQRGSSCASCGRAVASTVYARPATTASGPPGT